MNRAALQRSLQNPHPARADLADESLEEWACGLPAVDAAALVDHEPGKPVRRVPETGWLELEQEGPELSALLV